MSQNNDTKLSKLSDLLGAKITTVDAVPTSTRDNRVSSYRVLFDAIADGTTFKMAYADKKTARTKYSIIRGHCTRNALETIAYSVVLRGTDVYITRDTKNAK